jgi:hypothetical protein
MTDELIPFVPNQASSMEPLAGASPVATNVIVTGKGVLERRPGVCAADGLTSEAFSGGPIESVFQRLQGATFAFGTQDGVGPHRCAQIGSGYTWRGTASGTKRQMFAENELIVAVASGGYLQMLYGTLPNPNILSFRYLSGLVGRPPQDEYLPQATHVVAMSSRLTCNELRYGASRIRYSDVGDFGTSPGFTNWHEGIGLAGSFTAEDSPDPIVAVTRTREYLVVYGQQTVQLFVPDPQWTFAPAGTLSVGCAAPYSIIDSEYWIDSRKRIVRLQGGVVDTVSVPIQKELDAMDVSDAYGYRVEIGPAVFMVWDFPSDGRTFALQQEFGWSQWRSTKDGKETPFAVSAHYRSPVNADNLVGTRDGRIGKLSLEAQDDFGEPVRANVVTGFLDRGSSRLKRSTCLTLVMQRGRSSSSAPSQAVVSWRDREGPWVGRIPVSIGGPGDSQHTLKFRGLGVYERRQWMLDFIGPERLALVSATESFEVI